jgi:predicted patatin/cPLA2 family phospholipase
VICNNALVVEGGAMRSVFSAGLLDGFLERQFNPFDFYIGVSAGAFNLAAYLSGIPGKSLEVYQKLALDKAFISYWRFIRGGHLLDLDWLFETIPAASYLDQEAVYRPGKPFYVCASDVSTGEPAYINTTPENLERVMKASAALPLFYRNFPVIDGSPMTDGGVADGIPVAQAIRMGATRILVVRSRHKSYLKKDTLGHRFVRWKLRKFPTLVATMHQRVSLYEETISLIRNPPPGVKMIEVCPPEDFTIGRFNRRLEALLKGYQSGIEMAEDTIQKWGSD